MTEGRSGTNSSLPGTVTDATKRGYDNLAERRLDKLFRVDIHASRCDDKRKHMTVDLPNFVITL
jgi:hypothetical protein